MKHFRLLLPLLLLALVLSACGEQVQEPYDYTYNGKTITVDPENCTILDGADVYDYIIEKSTSRTSYVITYPNGATYHWTATETGGAGGWSENYDENQYIGGKILVKALEAGQPREKTGNVGIGLLLMGLGAVDFFLPELPFYLKYGWKFENAEPSEGYLTLTRVVGAIAAVLGLVWCII